MFCRLRGVFNFRGIPPHSVLRRNVFSTLIFFANFVNFVKVFQKTAVILEKLPCLSAKNRILHKNISKRKLEWQNFPQ